MAEFHDELSRFQAAQAAIGRSVSAEDAAQDVLDDLIDETLLAQGAAELGFSVDDAMLQSRTNALAESLGGGDALAAWQSEHGYTPEAFARALCRSIAAAWMRDQIIGSVAGTAEQVHVRQILLYNEETANEALSRLKAGEAFDDLAAEYDPVTRGELGWFPRGYLLEPAIEDAAFSLNVGEVSGIIHTDAGYHILKLLERDSRHPLSPDARLVLQEEALDTWLASRRTQSDIEFLLSP